MKKIFISLPMRGHTEEAIRQRMDDIYDLAQHVLNEPCELINTIHTETPPNPDNPVWYLGKSIQALGEADLVIFSSGWAQAKGCIIERWVCCIYNFNIMEEKDLWDLQNLEDGIREELFNKN